MQTNINPTAVSAFLILLAAGSLFTMLSLNQINYIVHGDLYNYGLQFSRIWATHYWVFSALVFALCWINITLSIVVTLHIYKRSRNPASDSEHAPQIEKIHSLDDSTSQMKDQERKKLDECCKTQDTPIPQEDQRQSIL
ncbi:MAG: hypothetical protein JSV51_05430 [Candidatus Bathyarchaeota archaeon]|nr:MAG: hypothetical protein JSV51_05430 [Candidatus Bathyarchaeota archaeon]